jgi:hypothetical protein
MFFSEKFSECAGRVHGYCQHTGEGTKAESVDEDKRKHERWHCAQEFKNAPDKSDDPSGRQCGGGRKGQQQGNQATQDSAHIGNQ